MKYTNEECIGIIKGYLKNKKVKEIDNRPGDIKFGLESDTLRFDSELSKEGLLTYDVKYGNNDKLNEVVKDISKYNKHFKGAKMNREQIIIHIGTFIQLYGVKGKGYHLDNKETIMINDSGLFDKEIVFRTADGETSHIDMETSDLKDLYKKISKYGIKEIKKMVA